jgi:hypothetical protein
MFWKNDENRATALNPADVLNAHNERLEHSYRVQETADRVFNEGTAYGEQPYLCLTTEQEAEWKRKKGE